MTVPIDDDAAILIVENEPLIAMDIEEMLRASGYRHVRHAASTAEADAWLTGDMSRSVVILDLFVLDGSTTGLAARLREREIPFVIYSGLPRHELDPDPVLAEAVWLPKPCSADELVAAISIASGLTP